jgi:uncharacterized metal-binding protein
MPTQISGVFSHKEATNMEEMCRQAIDEGKDIAVVICLEPSSEPRATQNVAVYLSHMMMHNLQMNAGAEGIMEMVLDAAKKAMLAGCAHGLTEV